MNPTIACVAPAVRPSRSVLGAVAERVRDARPRGFSLSGYLASSAPPPRVVFCPAGESVSEDRRFLEDAARRLLWPPPPMRLRLAIGALRNDADDEASPPGARAASDPSSALLLEGVVGPARARAALRANGPREWIVESPARVRLSRRELDRLASAGIRWWSLAPVILVGVSVSVELARAAASWRSWLPARTPVWIRPTRGGETPRRRPGRGNQGRGAERS